MSEPPACAAARCHHDTNYCSRCDLLVGLDGLHVVGVNRDVVAGVLTVRVEAPRTVMGCPAIPATDACSRRTG